MSTYSKICIGFLIGFLVCFAMSVRALSGYRDMLGIETFADVRQQIHECEKSLPRDQRCKATIRVEIAQ